MAIRITEDGVVNYENSPDVNRKLFPNLNVCGKEIDKLEEEINGKAPAVFSTASGSIASFDNGADDMPLKSCVVSINPIQEGEGDPSPENVRPISGRTGLTVYKRGANLVDDSIKIPNPSSTSLYIGGATGTSSYPLFLKKGTYTLSCEFAGGVHYGAYIKEKNSEQINIWSSTITSAVHQTTFTLQTDGFYRLWMYQRPDEGGVSVDGISYIMLNLGDKALPYEPYKQTENVSVNWETEAGTVYGGTVDIVSGKLTVDRAYIASYSGEILPSTWISDRDVYAAGTTPTTGAQVVYKLADPVEYQLSANDIRTLLRENIWSDGGDMAVEYPTDTKIYIDAFSIKTVEVSGQTPIITAEENTRYICGEVTSLTFTPCASGICDVRFTTASISTVLTLPQTLKLPDWFDPTLLEANTTYEINVVDGVYGAVMSWA